MIGDTVTLTILQVRGCRVRIGVNAPRDVRVRCMEKTECAQPTEHRHDVCRSP